MIPGYCGSCRHADYQGMVGSLATCTVHARTVRGYDECDQWTEERRGFVRLFPAYPIPDFVRLQQERERKAAEDAA